MRKEWISHGVIYVFTITGYVFANILKSPPSVGTGDVESYFFPKLILIVIAVLNTFSLIGTIKRSKHTVNDKESSINPSLTKSMYIKILVLILMMFGYVFMLPIVGYVVATSVLLVVMMLIYSVRSYKILISIPIGVVGVLFYVFNNLLKIPLP